MRLDGAYRAPALARRRRRARRQRADRSGRRSPRGAASTARRPRYRRERWPTPDGDFIDVDWQDAAPAQRRCSSCSTASKARRASHYAEAFAAERGRARLALSPCRTFAAARASSTSRRAPTTRATTRRSAGCSARCRERAPRPDRRGRRLARRQRAAALGRGGRRERRRERVRAVAAVSAPLDLAAGGRAIGRGFNRLVYTRMFLRIDEAEGAGQAGAAPRACSTASGCSPRATCTTSTTSSPRRCTAFATPTTTGRAPRPSRSWRASAFRRWCSMRATIRSCRRPALPRAGRGRRRA